jgi:adenylate cyclase
METSSNLPMVSAVNDASSINRRLAAVVFADVAGYSRLLAANESETLRQWKALRSEIMEPYTLRQGGRIAEMAGDALLVEFPSAVNAVRWAADVQRAVKSRQTGADPSPLSLRIGVNVEDIIVDDGTLQGDGVNIAARIHQAAEPGQIVITGTVREFVSNRLPVTFRDLGTPALKNIARQVQVFEVQWAQSAETEIPHRPYLLWTTRPTLAVLPFRNVGGTEADRYFGEGITEDIISGLSRSHALHVIAWSSTLRYRDRQQDVRQIAAELGVRYILEGGVRRRASRLRILCELIDAASSRALWTDKFDGADTEIFDFQDRIASRIVGAIEPRLYQAEAVRAFTKPTQNLGAYDCVLRAMSLLYTLDDRQFAETGAYLHRAVTLDPSYAQAHAYLAWWLNLKLGESRSSDLEGDTAKAVRTAVQAVQLDADDAFCLAVAGHIHAFLSKDLDAAVDLFDRALRLNENSAFAWGVSASTYCFLGRPDEALERLSNAWRLSPFDPLNFWFCTVAGIAEFVAARYDEAIGWLRKAQRLNPRFLACHRTLTAALALAGDVDAARAVAQQVLSLDPRFQISTFTAWYPLRRPDDLERLARGLRLADLPE